MDAHAIEDVDVAGYPAVALSSRTARLRVTVAPSLAMLIPSIEHRGSEILGQRKGVRAYAETGSTMGIPFLYPWANRLSGLDLEVAGRRGRLDPSSPLLRVDENGLPIHGLRTAGRGWRVTDRGADSERATVRAELDLGADAAVMAMYPYPQRVEIRASLAGHALAIETRVHAGPDIAVPVAFGFHPYLTLPGVRRAEWRLDLPGLEQRLLDDRGLPADSTERHAPVEHEALGDRTYDDLFVEVAPPRRFRLSGGGRAIQVRLEEGYPVAQIFAPATDAVICFEPMTAPTDALVAGGPSLPVVEPGGSRSTRFEIHVTDE